MNTEKAIAWFKSEIYSNNCAIKYRTVSNDTIAELENQNEVYKTALEAFEQLEEMTHLHDRLHDWDRGMTEKLEAAIAGQETLQKELAKYTTAEAEGRLVVLPCKVGNTVWYIRKWCNCDSGKPCAECKDKIMEVKSAFVFSLITYGDGEIWLHDLDVDLRASNIGKTVFFTREEAEAALAKEKA